MRKEKNPQRIEMKCNLTTTFYELFDNSENSYSPTIDYHSLINKDFILLINFFGFLT